jgi:hypothetical protein
VGVSEGKPRGAQGVAVVSPARFLSATLASLLAALALIGVFNVAVDPHGEFGLGLVPMDDADDHNRALKVALLRRTPEPPEALILGNSRSMALSPATVQALTGLRAFNAATAAGSAFDLLAFTRLALDQPRPLRLLVVGLDTFMLHPVRPMPDLLYFPLVLYLPETEPPLKAHAARVLRTVSIHTGLLSAQNLFYRDRPRPRSVSFDPDGRVRYIPYDEWVDDGRWMAPLPDALEAVRKQYRGNFSLDPEPTPQSQAALERWLEEARQAGVKIVIFLPPLHAYLRATLQREARYDEHLAAYRRYMDRLRGRFRFEFHDLLDVHRFGGDDRWFIDGTHMIGPNNDLVLHALFKDARRPGPGVALPPP